MALSKVEMVRQALLELGEASALQLAMFIQQRHGVRIDARFIPILRASMLEQEMLDKARQAARATAQPAEHVLSGSRMATNAAAGPEATTTAVTTAEGASL